MILNTDILYKKEHIYHEGHNLQTREEVDSQAGVHVHHGLFKHVLWGIKRGKKQKKYL